MPLEISLRAEVPDMWLRDYSPISTVDNKHIFFKHKYDFETDESAAACINSLIKLCKDYGMPYSFAPYLLDGGNFVTNHIDTAILTKGFLTENNLEEAEARVILQNLTGYTKIAFITHRPGDVLRHADCYVMFAN